jgi:RNA polymerase sigma-70 factor (ECF subfamily)
MMVCARSGDHESYERLLLELLPVLRRLVDAKWPTFHDNEDIVQEILVSLHTVQHTYDVNRPFSPWLMTIASRRMADAARHRYTRNVNELSVDVLPEAIEFQLAHDENRTKHETETLRNAIAALPAGQRNAIKLLKIHGYSLEEASDISGKSVASLKICVHRAIKSMRLILIGK